MKANKTIGSLLLSATKATGLSTPEEYEVRVVGQSEAATVFDFTPAEAAVAFVVGNDMGEVDGEPVEVEVRYADEDDGERWRFRVFQEREIHTWAEEVAAT